MTTGTAIVAATGSDDSFSISPLSVFIATDVAAAVDGTKGNVPLDSLEEFSLGIVPLDSLEEFPTVLASLPPFNFANRRRRTSSAVRAGEGGAFVDDSAVGSVGTGSASGLSAAPRPRNMKLNMFFEGMTMNVSRNRKGKNCFWFYPRNGDVGTSFCFLFSVLR